MWQSLGYVQRDVCITRVHVRYGLQHIGQMRSHGRIGFGSFFNLLHNICAVLLPRGGFHVHSLEPDALVVVGLLSVVEFAIAPESAHDMQAYVADVSCTHGVEARTAQDIIDGLPQHDVAQMADMH